MKYQINDFVIKLLKIQQDGDKSISGPLSWPEPNIIDIDTQYTKKIDEFANNLINEKPVWDFYIGSPGNGKSYLLGNLYKMLFAEGWHHKPELSEVSYSYEWYKNEEKFSRLWFVQDASAVKDTYDKDADEARDLANLIQKAWSKGISLVICANRGVLERVLEEHKPVPEEGWCKVIEWLLGDIKFLDGESESIKFDDDKLLEINRYMLDQTSLLEEGELSIANKIINDLVKNENWEVCKSCSAYKLCPFYNNRETLIEKSYRKKILDVINNAEVLTGQIVVFRELLALMSALLSGTSSDSNSNPCKWVKNLVESHDYMTLMSKRYYMQLFSAAEIDGLESDENYKKNQKHNLNNILELFEEDTDIKKILKSFLDGQKVISKDLGLSRLIGRNGSIRFQDPLRSALDFNFIDSDLIEELIDSIPVSMELEKKACEFWKDLIKKIDEKEDDRANEYVSTILRWSSSYMIRVGGFHRDKLYFNKPLKKFSTITSKISNAIRKDDVPVELKIELNRLEREINEIFTSIDKSTNDSDSVRLSENLEIYGEAIKNVSKIKINFNKIKPPFLKLPCYFGKDDKSVHVYLNGLIYCWLNEVHDSNLMTKSIPSEILDSIMQARTRAVSQSDYSRQKEDFKSKVYDETNRNYITVTARDEFAFIDESGE